VDKKTLALFVKKFYNIESKIKLKKIIKFLLRLAQRILMARKKICGHKYSHAETFKFKINYLFTKHHEKLWSYFLWCFFI